MAHLHGSRVYTSQVMVLNGLLDILVSPPQSTTKIYNRSFDIFTKPFQTATNQLGGSFAPPKTNMEPKN